MEGIISIRFYRQRRFRLRESTIEGLKEENSALMKAMLNNMKDYGYDFIYRYVNEKGEELCSINISPYDL